MLHGINCKQGTALWKLCLYFRSDAPLGAITYKRRLHKDSSPGSIAGFGESDRVCLVDACRVTRSRSRDRRGAPVNLPSDFERATMSTQDGLERELDMLLAKAGASVPPHLKAGILSSYRDMKVMAATVRQPRTAAAEPSNIFTLKSFARSA
jgi:hypothetical protein